MVKLNEPGTPRDMTPAHWARTLKRLRRNIEELRAYDCEVREPDNFDTPPSRRTGHPPSSEL